MGEGCALRGGWGSRQIRCGHFAHIQATSVVNICQYCLFVVTLRGKVCGCNAGFAKRGKISENGTF